jgi:hypothetical protein
VNLVVDQLTRNEHGVPRDPLWVLVEGEWVDGRSARKPATRRTAKSKRKVVARASSAFA